MYIQVICLIWMVLLAIQSSYFHKLSQGYGLQISNTNTTKNNLSQGYGLQISNTNTTKNITQSQSGLPTSSLSNKSMIDNRTRIFNQSKENGSNKMSADRMGQPLNGNPTNVERYIEQLGKSSPSQIASFPINDLPSETTIEVLEGLSAQNLYKVLKSISVDALSTLLQSFSPDQISEILNKLSPDQKMDIQSRATS
jgi:hypothetical protein